MRAAQDLSYSITCNWTASFLSIFLLLLTGKYPFYQFFYPVQISVSEVFFFLGSSESKVGLLSIYLFLVVIKASLARVRSISILSSLQSSSCLTDRFISISYSLWSSPDLDFWPSFANYYDSLVCGLVQISGRRVSLGRRRDVLQIQIYSFGLPADMSLCRLFLNVLPNEELCLWHFVQASPHLNSCFEHPSGCVAVLAVKQLIEQLRCIKRCIRSI